MRVDLDRLDQRALARPPGTVETAEPCLQLEPALPAVIHTLRMPYTYILECADGSYYVGSTWDLELRYSQHQSGVVKGYTSRRLPVRLAYAEEFDRIDEAYQREKQIQNWSRAKRRALIEGRSGDLPALSRAREKSGDGAD